MIIDAMKADRLRARKERDTVKVNALTLFLGDVETDTLRGVKFDDQVIIARIKKSVANSREYMDNLSEHSQSEAKEENAILESYLPKQLTSEELAAKIDDIKDQYGLSGIGPIMGKLKELYSGRFDGKEAAKLINAK